MMKYSEINAALEEMRSNSDYEHDRAILTEAKRILSSARNEICYNCGKYRAAHIGACDGCRWADK